MYAFDQTRPSALTCVRTLWMPPKVKNAHIHHILFFCRNEAIVEYRNSLKKKKKKISTLKEFLNVFYFSAT